MITFLAILSTIGISMILTLLIGEFFVERNKSSNFSKWWKRNVVGDNFENSDF